MATRTNDLRAESIAVGLSTFQNFCAGFCWILPKDNRRTTLRFNTIQRKYNARRTWRDMFLKPRQVGMTTLEICRDVFEFVKIPGSRIVVVCQAVADDGPIKKLSGDISRCFAGIKSAGLELPLETETATSWAMPSRGSSLTLISAGASIAAASKKGRASTYTRIHATEVAFWEHPEATLNAMLEGVPNEPTTSVVFESTPNGVGNWFHGMYTAAEGRQNSFTAHFAAWFEQPEYSTELEPLEVIRPQNEREKELVDRYEVTPQQLKWWRGKVLDKGLELVDQEYPSDPQRCFLSSGRKYFEVSAVDKMGHLLTQEPTISGDLRTWGHPNGERVVIGVDTAEGLGSEEEDSNAALAFTRTTRRHIGTMRNRMQAHPFADGLSAWGRELGGALIVVERNKGMALIGALENDTETRKRYPWIYYDDAGKPGINTNSTSRTVMLENLSSSIRDGSFTTPDPVLQAELKAFAIDPKNGRPFAPGKGKKNRPSDDNIFGAAMAWFALLQPDQRGLTESFDPRESVKLDRFMGGRNTVTLDEVEQVRGGFF